MYQLEGKWYYWYMMDYMGIVSVKKPWSAPTYPPAPPYTNRKYVYSALENLGFEFELEEHTYNPQLRIIDSLYYNKVKTIYPSIIQNSHHLLNSLEQDTEYQHRYTVHARSFSRQSGTDVPNYGIVKCHFYDISSATFKDVKDVYNTGFITEDQAANIVKELWRGTKFENNINQTSHGVYGYGSGYIAKTQSTTGYGGDPKLKEKMYEELYSLNRSNEMGLRLIGSADTTFPSLDYNRYSDSAVLNVPSGVMSSVGGGKVLVVAYQIFRAGNSYNEFNRVWPGVLFFPKPRYLPVPPSEYRSRSNVVINYDNTPVSNSFNIGYHYTGSRYDQNRNSIPSPLPALKHSKITKIKISVVLQPRPGRSSSYYKTYTKEFEFHINQFKPVVTITGKVVSGQFIFDIITDEVTKYKPSSPIKLISDSIQLDTDVLNSHELGFIVKTIA